MDWRLKALAFQALSFPGGAQVHYFLQRHATRNWPRQEKTLSALREIATKVVETYIQEIGSAPRSVLEIGAGRDLAVPIALRHIGVERVIASDINRLARLDLVRHAAKSITAGKLSPLSWDELKAAGIEYRAPDRVNAEEKVDCSCSNEVLEHIPPDDLRGLLRALRGATTGLTVHSIDYSDHYARTDQRTSRFNFLKYNDRQWRWFNSGMHYVNRLRHSDYVRMFRDAGFTIVHESSTLGEPPEYLRRSIAAQFQHYEPSDLFALKGRIVAA